YPKAVCPLDKPKKCMGIQQVLHYMWSLKSSSGASKSALILIFPLALPNLAGFLASDLDLLTKKSTKSLTSFFRLGGSDSNLVFNVSCPIMQCIRIDAEIHSITK